MILNQQQAVRAARRPLELFLRRVKNELGLDEVDLTVCLVSDTEIARMNEMFRRKKGPTDVLSFPCAAEPFETENRSQLGEVVISVQRATAQARSNRLSFDNEVKQLILHGLLHLCGYDHEIDKGEMNRLELRLRKELGI